MKSSEPVIEPVVSAVTGRPHRLPEHLPEGVYRADSGHVATVRWLAAVLALLILAAALPAIGHLNLARAPGWARAILLVSLVQWAYVAWMSLLPDWSTVRVVMVVFTVAGGLCFAAWLVVVIAPANAALPLGVETVRDKAARWCMAALLLNGLATYLCARTSIGWRRLCRRIG